MEKKIIQKFEDLGVASRTSTKKNFQAIDTRRLAAETDAKTAVVVEKQKTKKDIELINYALNKHFIFTSLPEENRWVLLEKMKHFTLNQNEIVFEQDQPGNNFFIVISGRLNVFVNGNKVNMLEARDSFGELALMHNTPRSATVVTVERTTLWGLDRKTFRTAIETLNAQNYLENHQFIESVPLFQILTGAQKDALVGSLSTLKFRPGEKVVCEGDPGDLFYIIKDGTVSCMKSGKEIRQMHKGDFFGEQALLYNSVRTATIAAKTDLKCVAIGRERLTKVLGSQLQHIIYQNTKRISMEKSETLSGLSPIQMNKAIDFLEVKVFKKGQQVIPPGTAKGSKLYIVLKGSLITRKNETAAEVFSCIGDAEIAKPVSSDFFEELFSLEDSAVAVMSKERFNECIGGSYDQIMVINEAFTVLKKIPIFKNLPEDRFQSLSRALELVSFQDGQIIFEQNQIGDSLFIIKSGKVDVIRNGANIRTITKLDYFGERSILNNETRTATVVARGNVECWVLGQEGFLSIIDDNLKNILVQRIELQDDRITLDDLLIVKLIGKGMFGNVFLAAHKRKKTLFALKTVERNKIEKYEIQENLILERKVLLQLDHIFILKLVKTFKDPNRVYFLTEFVKGMDLFDVLRELNLVSNSDSKFYVAILILILEHLHDRDIIYRDLKPENVMVDQDGYLKLIDFGTAKIVEGRTYTVVGTPHYMAPEVILGKGYGVTADYWSLGVMIFEFICGGVPFGENEQDPYVIYEKVLERKLVYPNFIEQRMPAKPFIEQLLNKNHSMRTGGGVENLKAHPWLNNIIWVRCM